MQLSRQKRRQVGPGDATAERGLEAAKTLECGDEVGAERCHAVRPAVGERGFRERPDAFIGVQLRRVRLLDEAREWTEGYGADAAVICTASNTSEPVEQAAGALRDRGRLIGVGITRMDLPWRTFYEKELDVRFSRSYGPGRYDPSYEWAACDYPVGYVRWTEQRNFEACLELMARGRINLEAITTRRAPFVHAPKVYQDLLDRRAAEIGVLLEVRRRGRRHS